MFVIVKGFAHPAVLSMSEKRWRRVLWYPTQAKIRLEWGTQLLLLVHRKFEVVPTRQLSHPLPVPAAKAGCPIQAVFWLEWDTTALDQWWWMDRVSTTRTNPVLLARVLFNAFGKLRRPAAAPGSP